MKPTQTDREGVTAMPDPKTIQTLADTVTRAAHNPDPDDATSKSERSDMDDDPLRPARGILFAVAAGTVFWGAVALLIWSL